MDTNKHICELNCCANNCLSDLAVKAEQLVEQRFNEIESLREQMKTLVLERQSLFEQNAMLKHNNDTLRSQRNATKLEMECERASFIKNAGMSRDMATQPSDRDIAQLQQHEHEVNKPIITAEQFNDMKLRMEAALLFANEVKLQLIMAEQKQIHLANLRRDVSTQTAESAAQIDTPNPVKSANNGEYIAEKLKELTMAPSLTPEMACVLANNSKTGKFDCERDRRAFIHFKNVIASPKPWRGRSKTVKELEDFCETEMGVDLNRYGLYYFQYFRVTSYGDSTHTAYGERLKPEQVNRDRIIPMKIREAKAVDYYAKGMEPHFVVLPHFPNPYATRYMPIRIPTYDHAFNALQVLEQGVRMAHRDEQYLEGRECSY